MSVVRAQTTRRWIIVAVVTAVLLALPAAISALPATSSSMPIAQLVTRIAASAKQPYQGYAVSTGNVGLPSLPQLDDVTGLFDGDTSLRIWYSSADRWRVDTVSTAGERDLYQSIGEQTIWDSGQNSFTTIVGTAAVRLPRGADLAPPDLARRLLSAATGSTHSALAAKRVAGRSAAGVRIVPAAAADTTVARVDIWADPKTGLPLEVDLWAQGGKSPVLVSRLLDVSLTAPSASVTQVPTPPPGVGDVVTNNPDVNNALANLGLGRLPDTLAGMSRSDLGLGSVQGRAIQGIGAYGRGFTQIVAASLPGRTGYEAFRAAQDVGVLTNYDNGQVVIVSTPLLNVALIHANNRRGTYIVAGLVPTAQLQQAGEELVGASQ